MRPRAAGGVRRPLKELGDARLGLSGLRAGAGTATRAITIRRGLTVPGRGLLADTSGPGRKSPRRLVPEGSPFHRQGD